MYIPLPFEYKAEVRGKSASLNLDSPIRIKSK